LFTVQNYKGAFYQGCFIPYRIWRG